MTFTILFSSDFYMDFLDGVEEIINRPQFAYLRNNELRFDHTNSQEFSFSHFSIVSKVSFSNYLNK